MTRYLKSGALAKHWHRFFVSFYLPGRQEAPLSNWEVFVTPYWQYAAVGQIDLPHYNSSGEW